MNEGHRQAKADLRTAVDAYSLAAAFDDDNPEVYYWRGVARSRLGDFTAALADFDTAIDRNPRYFDAYRMIEAILARDRQWDRILGCWDQFLALEPRHAEAYFERSGTHYHNADMPRALADLRQACQLGSQPACRQLRKLGQ